MECADGPAPGTAEKEMGDLVGVAEVYRRQGGAADEVEVPMAPRIVSQTTKVARQGAPQSRRAVDGEEHFATSEMNGVSGAGGANMVAENDETRSEGLVRFQGNAAGHRLLLNRRRGHGRLFHALRCQHQRRC